jgi:hypothetical protein
MRGKRDREKGREGKGREEERLRTKRREGGGGGAAEEREQKGCIAQITGLYRNEKPGEGKPMNWRGLG